MNFKTKTLAVAAAALLLSSPIAFAQSAGTSLTGTSNGKQGGPAGSGATGDTHSGVGASGGTASGSTGGSNAGQQPTSTSEQHEKLGN